MSDQIRTTTLWGTVKRQPIGYIALAVSILVLGIAASNYQRVNHEIAQWCAEHSRSIPAAEAYCKGHTP